MKSQLMFTWLWLLTPTVLSQQFSREPLAYDTSLLSESCNATVNTLVDECASLGDAFASGMHTSNPRRLTPICTASMGVCLETLSRVKKDIKLACSLKTDVFPADVNGAMMIGAAGTVLLGVARIADRTVPATFWTDGLSAIVKSSCKEALYEDAPGTEPDCSKYKYYFDTKPAQEFIGKSFRVSTADLKTANSCWYVLLEENITPELLLELNPSLDSGLARCALKPGLRYCLKKRMPILKTLFRWGWNIYSFVNICRGVLRVFGWV